MSGDIKVLIVDDSAFMRNTIGKIIEAAPGLSIASKAMNGVFALKKIKTHPPDVIVLDLEMPEMNGIEFLKERKRRGIGIPVVILSSIAEKGARITMEALSLGASDFVQKPSGSTSADLNLVADQLVHLLRAYGGSSHGGKTGAPIRVKPEKRMPIVSRRRDITKTIDVVAIGISTGGPNALRQLFSEIRSDFPVPILVVQHMPAGFTLEFASSLDRLCPLSVKEAEEGDVLKPGRVFVAPGGYHMSVAGRRLATTIKLSRGEPVNGHRPSVDVLFNSFGAAFGNRVLAVIMTGMGRDGVKGMGEIYNSGGITIAQDSESSVVYGMPKVAFENSVVDSVVSLDDMAGTLNSLVMKRR
jgi:two-component system, chemotaxis family, protein-glutamate methylesterase/glutaminase